MPRTLAYEPEAAPPSQRQRTEPPPSTTVSTTAHLPAAEDNAAIAVDALAAGTRVRPQPFPHDEVVLRHALLEGHRFAARPIAADELILS